MNIIKSNFTKKIYDSDEVCRIINMSQLASYIDCGVELLDLYTSKDYNTGKPILVGVVGKQDSYEAYKKWCNHELN